MGKPNRDIPELPIHVRWLPIMEIRKNLNTVVSGETGRYVRRTRIYL
jgi:hypothetical protein